MSLKNLPLFIAGPLWLLLISCDSQPDLVELRPGMVIKESVTIKPGRYELNASKDLNQPLISIMGTDIVVDFNGAELLGSTDTSFPSEYHGLALRIEGGKNITIQNARVRGYKVGLLAEGVDSLKVLDSDFSYNYRQRLGSMREREDLSDWLSYHNNEQDEWLRYGAALYLKNCKQPLVRGLRVTGGQNGLMLSGCDEGLFFNNTIHFNSGVGIGLYRSSRNRIMHNRLDWNVRGYSHGFYSRGQDSAGILCYEQSQQNIFAYNSATHSGDGFFLWAGQQTMDSGEGGCNDNIIYSNDFSFAPTNGIEATFSRNDIVNNRMEGCRYGIWGGYSYGSRIIGNELIDNEYGLAIEQGNKNTITANYFEGNETGVQLWARDSQPAGWGFARERDVSSRNYEISDNVFKNTEIPLEISRTREILISGNTFVDFDQLLAAEYPNEVLQLRNNTMNQTLGWGDAVPYLADNEVEMNHAAQATDATAIYNNTPVQPLPDGMEARLPPEVLKGRSFILVDEWGPYDFQRPSVWLRGIEKDNYVFLLLGPQGNWKLTGGKGFAGVNPKTGTFPATVTAKKKTAADLLQLDFTFIGEAVTGQFGESYRRGTPIPFTFFRYEYPFDWWLRFYEYGEKLDPLGNYEAFRQLRERKAGFEIETDTLAFTWWRSPGGGIAPDRFATFAETNFEIPEGVYLLSVTSDDGLRLYLDGEMLIDHWNIHTPAVDEVEVRLGGTHRIEIEHFDATGLATLDFRLKPVIIRSEEQ